MTADRKAGRAPRVGLFGLLGSGNIGNDASMESVLSFLNTHHPDAVIDAMCMGPERLKSGYGITAIPLQWSRKYEQRAPRPVAIAAKMLSKGIDAFRTAAWVRGHDAVIVPGMGVMEASTPLWPWGVPYAMFLLAASGRVLGTKVALVSVGASRINQPMTRSLFNWPGRQAGVLPVLPRRLFPGRDAGPWHRHVRAIRSTRTSCSAPSRCRKTLATPARSASASWRFTAPTTTAAAS